MKYKHLFFDIDNTLLDFNQAEEDALRMMFEALGIAYHHEILTDYRRINGALWQRHETENLPIKEVLNTRFAKLFETYGQTVDGEKMERQYRKLLEEGHDLMPNAMAILDALSDYPLYIVTNGVKATQHKRLKLAGIHDKFEGIFISSEIGYQKPNPMFFEKAFSTISNFDPKLALIIGDTLGADILGGNNVGVDTVWYNPHRKENTSEIQPTFEIHDLMALQSIIKDV